MRFLAFGFGQILSLSIALASVSVVLLSLSIAQAVRLPYYDSKFKSSEVDVRIQRPSLDSASALPRIAALPLFREAPAFRNGQDCAFTGHFVDELEQLCDPASVHIAMTLDATYMRGSVAAILSIVQHSACPENIVFHFLASEGEGRLAEGMRNTFPYLRFKVYHFDESLVRDVISTSIREALEQPLNYARTYIADILPECVQRVIYLDSDVVVVDDIVKLWATDLGSHALGAPEYCLANFSTYFTPAFWLDAGLSSVFDGKKPCYFNTGVMVMDLNKWRQKGLSSMIVLWMEMQKELRIYELGSLPPFLLVFAGDVQPVDRRWNQHGLGGDNFEGHCRPLHPGPVSLLHWSGKGKPWIRLQARRPCPLDSLWAPYDLSIPFSVELK